MILEQQLQRTTPEAQGIPAAAILAFVQAAEATTHDLHSLMLLRHGQVVAEGWWSPYGATHPHMLFSLSKSFASTAVGVAVAEGRLSVEDRVIDFFPAELPAEVSDNLAAMRVRHLLTMSTGHVQDTTGPMTEREDGDWVKAFLAQPVTHAPGAPFVYNSGATYMLSAIVQTLTGQRLVDYLRPRLFDPLGIKQATWQRCPRDIDVGGWGLNITTEDIARFGQLYLQKGVWQGKQVVPADWVAAATSAQVDNSGRSADPDWEQGYGYQFWRCRHNAYRGDGAFGQFCIVMPDQDAVLAITSGVPNMQAVLDLVWTHLLPAMQPEPIAEDPAVQDALARKLANLALAPMQGQVISPVAEKVSDKEYSFTDNPLGVESIRIHFTEDGCELTARDQHGTHQLRCRHNGWRLGETTAINQGHGARLVAASGAWTDAETYSLLLCFYETPFCPTLVCRFVNGRLRFQYKPNVGFGPLNFPEIEGQAMG
jgi:CubicO group peptidase (beta-lactamase class C family)